MKWWETLAQTISAHPKVDVRNVSVEYLLQAERIAHTLKQMLVQAHTIANGSMFGTVQSWVKGRGVQFAGIRVYSESDDARLIDWNTTARLQKTMVRYATEERNNDVYVILDVSGSMMSGIGVQPIQNGLLTVLSCLYAIDRMGDAFSVIAFSPAKTFPMVQCSPLGKGEKHIMQSATCLMQEILAAYPDIEHASNVQRGDALEAMLHHAIHSLKKRSIVFFISDGMTKLDQTTVRQYAMGALRKHECVYIGVRHDDTFQKDLHAEFLDVESGKSIFSSWKTLFRDNIQQYEATLSYLKDVGFRIADIAHERDIAQSLRILFRQSR